MLLRTAARMDDIVTAMRAKAKHHDGEAAEYDHDQVQDLNSNGDICNGNWSADDPAIIKQSKIQARHGHSI